MPQIALLPSLLQCQIALVAILARQKSKMILKASILTYMPALCPVTSLIAYSFTLLSSRGLSEAARKQASENARESEEEGFKEPA